MGFFSWMTSDTNKSVSNMFSNRGALPVCVLCPDGGKIIEENYEGYGVFGGYDIFVLLAKWNKPESCKDIEGNWIDEDLIRHLGIDINYSGEVKYPIKIVEDSSLGYDDVGASESCPEQGFFYDDEEDDEDEDYDADKDDEDIL